MLVFKPSCIMSFDRVESDRQRLVKTCHVNNPDTLLIDLTDVDYCDSAGLAFLIEAKRYCHKQQYVCKINNMPQATSRLAAFCGLEQVLYDTP